MRVLFIGPWLAWLTSRPRLITHSVRATLYRAPVYKFKDVDYVTSGGTRALGCIRADRYLVLGTQSPEQARQEAASCVGLRPDRRDVVRDRVRLRAGVYASPSDVVEYEEAIA